MNSQKITLNVDGMSCGHCSGTVQKALEGIENISDVSVDLKGKKAVFKANNENLITEAVKKIGEAGYKASVI